MKSIILFVVFISYLTVYSQSVGDFGNDPLMMGDIEDKLKKQQESLMKESSPSTGFVNPKYYYLGPGDVIFLKAFPSFPQGEMLTISPEGSLVLPRSYGIIDVKGKSLEDITEEVKTRIKSDNVQISLYKSKNAVVEIKGSVLNEKIYTLPGSYRVGDLYNLANTVPTQTTNEVLQLKEINKYKSESRFSNEYSDLANQSGNYFKERNIKVLRDNGDVIEVDLVKSRNPKNAELNPYLMPGDKVFVSDKSYEYNTFQIRGAVTNPTTVLHKKDDKLSDLIKLASGLKPTADLENIKLYNPDNSIIEIRLNDNLDVVGDDPILEPNSILIIGEKQIKKISRTGVVSVTGEVNKPGAILIKNGETKLSEVIELAGGLKETAYLPLARVLTKQNDFDADYWELYRDDVFFQYSDLTVDDTLRLNKDAKLLSPYLAINFEDALSGSNDDVPLNDGDKIIIPKNPRRVYVFGKVYNPGYVQFEEGKDFKWYIEQVGGSLPSAHTKRIRVIRGSNFTWVEPDEFTIIYAGDMIYVPSPKELSEQAEIQKWATYTNVGIALVNVIFTIIIQLIYLRRNQ